MKPAWITALCGVVAVFLVGACVALNCPGSVGAAVPSRRIPAQELPRRLAVPVPPFEVTWAPGVLEAASMYFPAEMEMLEVVHSEPTKQRALDLAARVGVPVVSEMAANLPEVSTAEEGCYRWDFGTVEVNVFRDGNAGLVWYDRDLPAEYSTSREAGPAPRITADEAVRIADQFLRDAGQLPDGCRMTEVTPKGATTRHSEVTGPDEVAALAFSVVYRRFRDGIPEGRIGVWVTGKGEVFSFSRNVRDVRSFGRYPILRPDEARGTIWSPAARVQTDSNSPARAIASAAIEKVEMEYYDGATAWRYDTIQPVYIFTGTGWDSQGRPQGFSAMVPAVRPEYLEPTELPRGSGAAGSAKTGRRETPGKPVQGESKAR